MEVCRAYLKNGKRKIRHRAVQSAIRRVNEERFQNLFNIDYHSNFNEFIITGQPWFKWVKFSITSHCRALRWYHSDDIVTTEWTTFTFCHKAARILTPDAFFRDEDDKDELPSDFDLRFPTLDVWIRQLYSESEKTADAVINATKLITPDCFWINQLEAAVAPVPEVFGDYQQGNQLTG